VDVQILFNIMVGVAGLFGGWILNNISQSIRTLDKDVRNMPLTYVTQAHYQRDINEIKGMLDKIFNKLDEKMDK
jgi:capsular polysaccharide biosynthesis protein